MLSVTGLAMFLCCCGGDSSRHGRYAAGGSGYDDHGPKAVATLSPDFPTARDGHIGNPPLMDLKDPTFPAVFHPTVTYQPPVLDQGFIPKAASTTHPPDIEGPTNHRRGGIPPDIEGPTNHRSGGITAGTTLPPSTGSVRAAGSVPPCNGPVNGSVSGILTPYQAVQSSGLPPKRTMEKANPSAGNSGSY